MSKDLKYQFGNKKNQQKNVNIAQNSAKFEKVDHIAPLSAKTFRARATPARITALINRYMIEKKRLHGWSSGVNMTINNFLI